MKRDGESICMPLRSTTFSGASCHPTANRLESKPGCRGVLDDEMSLQVWYHDGAPPSRDWARPARPIRGQDGSRKLKPSSIHAAFSQTSHVW